MAQKLKIDKTSISTKGNMGIFDFMAITRQQISLECCSNPPKIGKVL